ncbi:AraC family transcriptional regulator [Alkalicoccobacillus murimartini]|uniref:AraC-like DNA-binding protein n=1 Tax=Alkalicoccobacillus murimartini TaxID=171685 RepID=A0ABT9YI59_9BACI|nr:AraC family transcriptional regulator [Alkalicoccobacillus murimartini]MDQ0207548.1 AraC-like DNA-binding protein [Alkalicoccobacillus murimartini]
MKGENVRNSFMEKQKELAQFIQQFCDKDGIFSTDIPCLHFIRVSHKLEPLYQIHKPALCIVAQGTKVVIMAEEIYQYDPSKYLVVSVDLPLSGEIIEASDELPYLCLRLDFESKQIFDILKESEQLKIKETDSHRGLFVSNIHSSLLDAVLRLVHLLDTPEDISVLAPSVIREILYRILQGDQGRSVKQVAMIGSHAERVVNVIKQIKQDFTRPIGIKRLASIANMSESSLHHHFKQVTGSTPLQYQKQLRLQEARRLMLSQTIDAANASFQVGYESPSQFSREYARLFGLPPIRDMQRIRNINQINL